MIPPHGGEMSRADAAAGVAAAAEDIVFVFERI